MPRNGDGSSDNGPFEAVDHNIAHGVGKPDSDRVDRRRRLSPALQTEDGQLRSIHGDLPAQVKGRSVDHGQDGEFFEWEFEHLVARLRVKEAMEVSSRATTVKIRVAGKTSLAMIRLWRG